MVSAADVSADIWARFPPSSSFCAASPGVEFDLNMSFPRKKLEDKSLTIEAAQLQNAALTQSLK